MFVCLPEKPETPSAPTVSKVTDKAVTLTWSASASEITHYMVEKRNADDRSDAWKITHEKLHDTTCVIDNLNYGDRIQFRVTAVNQDIFSEPSSSTDKILIEGKWNDMEFKTLKKE